MRTYLQMIRFNYLFILFRFIRIFVPYYFLILCIDPIYSILFILICNLLGNTNLVI